MCLYFHISKVHRFISIVAFFMMCTITVSGQNNWKGFDLTRTTSAFGQEVPVGTNYLIVYEYDAEKKFGEVVTGALKSTIVYEFDDHGYLTKCEDNIYKNIYNADGNIEQCDVFCKKEFKERRIYKYTVDEKGPGVMIAIYNADGKSKGVKAWQGDSYCSIIPGEEEIYAKLNKAGHIIKQKMTTNTKGGNIDFNAKFSYNDHGCLEGVEISGLGRSQYTSCSDYVYDDNGVWIERYSDHILTKRRILSKEEYVQIEEQKRAEAERAEAERAEAERKRLAKIAEEVSVIKQNIAAKGFMNTGELFTKPIAKVEAAEVFEPVPVKVELVIPDKGTSLNWKNMLTVDVEKPAQFKFPNDSIGAVPSQFVGTITSRWLRYKEFSSPLEIKIMYDEKAQSWCIKGTDKLPVKYKISVEEVNLLNKLIADKGKEKAYNTKKLYLFKISQLSVNVESSKNSALECYFTKKFPIRFDIRDSK